MKEKAPYTNPLHQSLEDYLQKVANTPGLSEEQLESIYSSCDGIAYILFMAASPHRRNHASPHSARKHTRKNLGSHCAMPRDSSGPTVACLCQHPSPTTRHPHPFSRRNRPSATRNRTRCHHRHPLHTPLHPITRQRPVRCDHL